MDAFRGVVRCGLSLALVSGLIACGGGGGDDGGPSVSAGEENSGVSTEPVTYWDCGGAGGIGLFFTWLAGGCTLVEVSSPSQIPSNPGIVEPETIDGWGSNYLEEVEPNDTFSEATPIYIGNGNGQPGGRRIVGIINDTTDPRDLVAVGVEVEERYGVYLCRGVGDCMEFLSTEQAYLEIYDQNEVLLATTHINGPATGSHNTGYNFTPGIPYYVSVVADRTQGVDFQYEMIITQ